MAVVTLWIRQIREEGLRRDERSEIHLRYKRQLNVFQIGRHNLQRALNCYKTLLFNLQFRPFQLERVLKSVSYSGGQPNLNLVRRALIWISANELWLLLLFAIPLFLSSNIPLRYFLLSLAVILILWISRWLAKGHLSIRTPMDGTILLLLMMTGVSLLASANFIVSLRAAAEFFAEVALFYSLVNSVSSEKRLGWSIAFLVAFGVISAATGLLSTAWLSGKYAFLAPIYDHLPNQALSFFKKGGFSSNIVAGTLDSILPLIISLTFFGSRRYRLGSLVALLMVGSVYLLTQSRGGVVGIGIALVILMSWRWPKLRWSIPILVAGIGGLVLALGPENASELLLASDTTGSAAGRFELWQRAIYAIQDFPFTGIGIGTFSVVLPILYPTFLISPDTSIPHAHNLYLQTAVDLGIPGFVALIAFISIYLYVAFDAVTRSEGGVWAPVAIGLLAGYAVYLAHGLTDDVTFSTKPGTILWCVAGLTVSLWNLLRSSYSSVKTSSVTR